MFHYFKIPYFTCTFFTKFTYNEYIGPYFLSHVVLRFFASDLPEVVSLFLLVYKLGQLKLVEISAGRLFVVIRWHSNIQARGHLCIEICYNGTRKVPCVTGEYSFLPTTVLVEGTDLPGEEVLSYIKSFRRVSLLWKIEIFG